MVGAAVVLLPPELGAENEMPPEVLVPGLSVSISPGTLHVHRLNEGPGILGANNRCG